MPPKRTAAAAAKASTPQQKRKTTRVEEQEKAKKKEKDEEDQQQLPTTTTQTPPQQRRGRAAKSARTESAAAAADKSDGTDSGGSALAATLLEGLCAGTNVATLVAQTINALQVDATAACGALVHLICAAAGARDVAIAGHSIADASSVPDVLEEVFARLPPASDASAVYLLIHREAKYKRFRKSFPAFWERLVVAGFAAGVLHSDDFFPVLTPWLAGMSESKARGLRHTASCALFSLIQGLNDRAVNIAQSLETTTKREAPALQAKYDAIVELQSRLFSVSLHQRVKDVSPEIRLLAVQSLKDYFLRAPDIYVNNSFLRYLILAFHDKRAEIRLEALDFFVLALTTLHAHLPRMQDFTRHIAKRIVELTNDVDSKCADLALKAAALVIKYDFDQGNEATGAATFDHEMIDAILMTLMDDRAGIRQTAGLLLKVVIRCRNAHAEEEAQPALRSQTLVFLAATLRAQYKEPMAEAYLVDALWRESEPPRLLTEFRVFLELAQRADAPPADALTGLRLLTAILRRIRGELDLGPAGKDDVRHGGGLARSAGAGSNANADLAASISREAVPVLEGVVERLSVGDPEVLACIAHLVAALDLRVLTTQQLAASFRNVLVAMRRGSAALKADGGGGGGEGAVALCNMWRVVAFEDHPQKSEGDAQLRELLKQVLKQLASTERGGGKKEAPELEDVYCRTELLSGIVALTDQLGLFKAALTRFAAVGATALSVLRHVVPLCCNTLLWLVGAHQADPALDGDVLAAHIASVASTMLHVAQMPATDEPSLVLRCDTLVRLCDLAALPQLELSQADQTTLVELIADASDECNDVIRALYERTRETLQGAAAAAASTSAGGSTAAATTAVTTFRHETTLWEGRVMRLSAGLARLFTLDRLDAPSLAPRALLLWTRTPLKAASDLFKALFHFLRDKSPPSGGGGGGAGSSALEIAILNAAYAQCAALGVNNLALEQLHSVGAKLAAMHFLPSDRHYPAAVAVVRFAVDFATSTDPTMLHAVAPYCARLRQHDALALANELSRNELFAGASQSNVFIATFVASLRRAARLDDGGARPPALTPARGVSASVTAATTAKRARAAAAAANDDDDAAARELEEVLSPSQQQQQQRGAARRRGAAPSATPTPGMAARRITDADGWRVRDAAPGATATTTPGGGAVDAAGGGMITPAVVAAGATVVKAPAPAAGARAGAQQGKKRGGAAVAAKPSPNTTAVSTMLGELDSEVFIATHEWNE